MIYDNLKHLESYVHLGGNFEKAFAFLKTIDPAAMTEGSIEIDGKNVYAFVSKVSLKNKEELRYEAHRNYADIQVVLSGSEVMYCDVTEELGEIAEGIPERDIYFYGKGSREMRLLFQPGDFAIFYPQDAHMPCCMTGDGESVKLVVKVRIGDGESNCLPA